jgi:transcriptional regulator with XRE-family HTH domain
VIGMSLKKARAARGWSQKDAAVALGIGQGTYNAYESSGALPANEVLDRIVEKMPELAGRVAEVRKLRPKRSKYARAAVGGQTTEVAEREHMRHKAAAERRRT